jgi:RNA polymerase subunit RPABC4/transcription elongation factor Spt4
MSFEGYFQKICANGHYWQCDVYDETDNCPICDKPEVWENMVDITNGSYEDDKRIDGYIELEIESERKCEHCGTILERRYYVPKT